MIDMEDKVREALEKEAKLWVEKELAVRMQHAREAIESQAAISVDMCGQERAAQHVRDATDLAEQNYRLELEFEAQEWVEGKLKERSRPMLEDHNLEANRC